MIEVAAAAFGLGLLLGWQAAQHEDEIRWTVRGYLPTRCAECGKWTLRKRTAVERHRVAGWVHICETCHDRLDGKSER